MVGLRGCVNHPSETRRSLSLRALIRTCQAFESSAGPREAHSSEMVRDLRDITEMAEEMRLHQQR